MGKFMKRNLVVYKGELAIVLDVIELKEWPFDIFYKIQSSLYGEIEVLESDLSVPYLED